MVNMPAMWFVGLDVHSETTAVSIRSSRGVVVLRKVVPTTSSELRRALAKIRGRVKIACEAGPLAPWLHGTLTTQMREVIVCHCGQTDRTRGGLKSDRFDADRLSESLWNGSFRKVYVPQGPQLELRRSVYHYVRMVRDRTRIKQRLKALFLESAIRLGGDQRSSKRPPIRSLPKGSAREVARAYLAQIQAADELVKAARVQMVDRAAADPAFAVLQTFPHIGEIRAAMLLGIIGTAGRFSARRKFWAYAGLGVVQRISSEHRLEKGEIVRESRSRGLRLARAGHPLLKSVLSAIVVHVANGRGELRKLFDRHVARGKAPQVARLALTRKIASIILAMWRAGEPYDPSRVFPRKIVSGRASITPLSRKCSNVRKATAASICRPERT